MAFSAGKANSELSKVHINSVGEVKGKRKVENPFSFDVLWWDVERPQVSISDKLVAGAHGRHSPPSNNDHR